MIYGEVLQRNLLTSALSECAKRSMRIIVALALSQLVKSSKDKTSLITSMYVTSMLDITFRLKAVFLNLYFAEQQK